MAYTPRTRNEHAAERLRMLGVERDPSISAYGQERRMGLTNVDKRAEYVRQHDWFYRGTVGSHGNVSGRHDSHQMAKDYVKGFLYQGKQTKSRKEARDRFRDEVDVDWNLWRDYRYGYGRSGGPMWQAVEDEDIYYGEDEPE